MPMGSVRDQICAKYAISQDKKNIDKDLDTVIVLCYNKTSKVISDSILKTGT